MAESSVRAFALAGAQEAAEGEPRKQRAEEAVGRELQKLMRVQAGMRPGAALPHPAGQRDGEQRKKRAHHLQPHHTGGTAHGAKAGAACIDAGLRDWKRTGSGLRHSSARRGGRRLYRRACVRCGCLNGARDLQRRPGDVPRTGPERSAEPHPIHAFSVRRWRARGRAMHRGRMQAASKQSRESLAASMATSCVKRFVI
jgi:hypothetical protein